MRIRAVTLFDDAFSLIGKVCVGSISKFSENSSIVFSYRDKLIDESIPAQWNKIALLLSMLENNDSDWIIWIDADTVMVRQFDFNSELSYVPNDKHLVHMLDANGICLCVFALRNCEWSKRLLSSMMFLGDVTNESIYGIGQKWEQNCLKSLCVGFRNVESCLLSCGSRWCQHHDMNGPQVDMLIPFHHFGAMPNDDRLALMTSLFKNTNNES